MDPRPVDKQEPPVFTPIHFEDVNLEINVVDISSQLNKVFGGFDAGLEDKDEEDFDLENDDNYKQFQTSIHVAAASRTEGNQCAGGKKTSKANLKCWNTFAEWAIKWQLLCDGIVDEHSMLLYGFYTANRPQRNRVLCCSQSQIKKEMFGAIQLCKVQEAKDPSLKASWPAATVYVYDVFCTLMDEALKNKYEGLIEGEDAPDVVANTFLNHVTEETLSEIGEGFLSHRESKYHLWYQQPIINSSLSETVNPVYMTFVAHRNPEMCPLGALAFYLHYLFDVIDVTTKYSVNYTHNKSWRNLYLVHGMVANVPYNDTSLINLFGQAYKKVRVHSHLKQHLARHMLGYKQETMGVDKNETSKLGWSRDTYSNVYAPAFPKQAILGAHGYKAHEEYCLLWQEVPVPTEFLMLFCPSAEGHLASVQGKPNLLGVTKFWEMVIKLWPTFFQCAAAMYQKFPTLALFRLPALMCPDVQAWMKTNFAHTYTLLIAVPSNNVDLARISDQSTRLAFEELCSVNTQQSRLIQDQSEQIAALMSKINHHMSQWLPPKAFVVDASGNPISRQLNFSADARSTLTSPSSAINLAPSAEIDPATRRQEDIGIYYINDESPRAFALLSPTSSLEMQPQTQIDLVLPASVAFCKPGSTLTMPSFLGRELAEWSAVFEAVQQPQTLWQAWRPSKSLDQMSINDVWNSYMFGEKNFNDNGQQTGVKPPLQLVEQHFGSSWQKLPAQRKAWQRFQKIPEWIEHSDLSLNSAIKCLEVKQEIPGKKCKLGTNALAILLKSECKEQPTPLPTLQPTTNVNQTDAREAGPAKRGARGMLASRPTKKARVSP
ncbi:hypothetical protein BDN71DRAFT_1512599 [Pleurotus eryngii]|uniref:Ndc10 domain-containing protein n=1 Tax=Pleurotus eryngii TaxID=5323 RepID=A0A9P5ZMD2_PLEER|nr:hypothetical protein BDN71DRAFT_1512599 [Pleurotus eryngii]